ncbi:MAG: hypothetical protein MZW92_75340 [Comamonadaceae bacterium]|nr:hypothetical protein [Comamonadaceae bacterium]
MLVEWLGSPQDVATVKALVAATPGLWILIPAMALAGASGMRLARSRGGAGAGAKRNRLAAGRGERAAGAAALRAGPRAPGGGRFWSVRRSTRCKPSKLLAGANGRTWTLMLLNVRDGLRIAGRMPPRSATRAPSA